MLDLEPVPDWGHGARKRPSPYEDTETYRIAARFLDIRGTTVEDWGCATAWARQFYDRATYVGIDGTDSPMCDVVADLRTYRSEVEGIHMRHVLEHNTEWRMIVENFAASWTQRAALCLFIPPQPEERDVGGGFDNIPWPIPDIAVSGPELFELLDPNGDVRFVDFQQFEYPPEHSMQWSWEGLVLMERHA